MTVTFFFFFCSVLTEPGNWQEGKYQPWTWVHSNNFLDGWFSGYMFAS